LETAEQQVCCGFTKAHELQPPVIILINSTRFPMTRSKILFVFTRVLLSPVKSSALYGIGCYFKHILCLLCS
jgi:hypothetical protein